MNKIKEFVKGLKKGQKKFGEDISNIVSSFLLTLVYVIGVGLTSLIARIGGKKFLNLKLNKNAETYWESLNLDRKPIEQYYHQF